MTLNENQLRDYSLRALTGDQLAINYLKRNNASPLTGKSLWSGFNPTEQTFMKYANGNKTRRNSLEWEFMNQNKDHNYTINYDMKSYDDYRDRILNNKTMSDTDMDYYYELINRRNLDDIKNPFVQQAYRMEQDKKSALAAQDTALNQGMSTMDANSFKQFQQLQQDLSQRGVQDSGIAADSYMRAQMANNQNYQKAFADSATTKANLQTQYNKAISDAKIGKFDYDAKLQQAEVDQQLKLQEIQNEQDKWLTESTGNVYINGKRIMSNGQPITTVEWEKLSEEKRHNLAGEAIDQQKNAWDFQLGQEKNQIAWDSNAIKRQGIAVDLQIALGNMEIDKAKLDFNYAKLESTNAIAQDKLALARDNAQTSADKAKIDALGKELNSLTSQITAYQKAGKKPPAKLVDAYNNVVSELRGVAGNF